MGRDDQHPAYFGFSARRALRTPARGLADPRATDFDRRTTADRFFTRVERRCARAGGEARCTIVNRI